MNFNNFYEQRVTREARYEARNDRRKNLFNSPLEKGDKGGCF
jgi:hypothetical protein